MSLRTLSLAHVLGNACWLPTGNNKHRWMGEPVDVLVVFNGRVYISMFILVYSWSYIQIFLGKNQEWWVSKRSAFFFSNFRFFDFVVFFWVWPFFMFQKNRSNSSLQLKNEAHPHIAEAGTLAGNLLNTRKRCSNMAPPVEFTSHLQRRRWMGSLRMNCFWCHVFCYTVVKSKHGPSSSVP